jgi:hypothetical protein
MIPHVQRQHFVITLSISRQNHPDQVAHRPSRAFHEIRHDRPDSVEWPDLMATLLRSSDKTKRPAQNWHNTCCNSGMAQ